MTFTPPYRTKTEIQKKWDLWPVIELLESWNCDCGEQVIDHKTIKTYEPSKDSNSSGQWAYFEPNNTTSFENEDACFFLNYDVKAEIEKVRSYIKMLKGTKCLKSSKGPKGKHKIVGPTSP